ncbi:MAG TPA: Type 1 glutamine amidotransferase-like domain-containing protein [Euzebyales bacterium]|nr:Type 1 glutamine amidotransferase-like domain-containing protein [Euzebyales bacterium]
MRIVVPPRTRGSRPDDALAAADVIVLTGGMPGRLITALGASPLWDMVLDRWRAGAVLSGSSAGAIALFAWRLALRVPNPLRVVPGLGPLDGHVCMPHFDRFVGRHPAGRRWVQATTRRLGGLGTVGIDEATALVVDGHHLHVLGHGAVTFVDRTGWHSTPAPGVVLRPWSPVAWPGLRERSTSRARIPELALDA